MARIRPNGGLLGNIAVTANSTVASGMFHMIESNLDRISGNFPQFVPTATDPQFNLTTLLLHGDGSNNANNNTFLDTSTNALAITRTGTPTQGTFSPFSQTGWSNYFNGSSDYVSTTSSSTAFSFGTGDFTVEMWVNTQAFGNRGLFQSSTTSGGFNSASPPTGTGGIQIYLTSGATVGIMVNGAWNNTATTVMAVGAWYHIALVRSGTSVKLYINGTADSGFGTVTDSSSYTATYAVYGGYFSGSYLCNSYISNLRVLKGTALYTGNFTPSSSALTAIANTSYLVCQSNRFVDNSASSIPQVTGGTPSVQPFSPFAPGAAYGVSSVGGSAYFNGSADYISAASNAGLGLVTGDYTFECWIYRTSTSRAMIIAIANAGLSISINTSNQIEVNRTLTAIDFTFTGATVTNNSWQHIAVVRIGTNLNAYINGVSAGTTQTSSTNYGTGGVAYIGIDANGSTTPWSGFISNLRLVKGTGVYSGAFTPPTAPVTAITNTQLLVNGTNAGIYDSTAKNLLITATPVISTAQSKFGGSSMSFDGTSNGWIKNDVNSSGAVVFRTGDFTVECWFYPTANSGTFACLITSRVATITNSFFLGMSGLTPLYYRSTAIITAGGAVSLNTWNHLALVRYNGTSTLYLNGSSTGTPVSDTTDFTDTAIRIGFDISQGAFGFTGYMDDIRISKYARYTTTFVPATSAFANQ